MDDRPQWKWKTIKLKDSPEENPDEIEEEGREGREREPLLEEYRTSSAQGESVCDLP